MPASAISAHASPPLGVLPSTGGGSERPSGKIGLPPETRLPVFGSRRVFMPALGFPRLPVLLTAGRRSSTTASRDQRLELLTVVLRVEPVQWIGWKRMFCKPAVAPDVHDRRDRSVGGVLDCDGNRVAAPVDEVRERDDAPVAVTVAGLDNAREVPLLDPQLGRAS